MRITILLLLLLASLASAQTVYKVITEDGKVIYSDRPAGNAKPVELKKLNSVSLPPVKNRVPTATVQKKPEVKYTIAFKQPADQATVRNNNGTIRVSATITPRANGLFHLFMDGKQVASNTQPNFTLQNVDRGAHHLQIKYLSGPGKVLASSPSIEVFMHRASIFIRPS
ncbi:DUF4124 domain-containing protein [Alteromonadaceae bacterium M269]|nr:DUF4124 domain-containing protein [Alteromonadaceae bacterium M269]